LQFDHVRGYGFVGADDDGEDVFLHASVFDGDPEQLAPGTKLEFKVMAGDRGRKAFAARAIDDGVQNDLVPPPRTVSPLQPVPGPRLGPASPPPLVSSAPLVVSSAGPKPSLAPVQASAASASDAPRKDHVPDDEPMCDVLSAAEFGQELTELLVSSIPSLTGQQVLQVRKSVLESAKSHGWVDV
jgi:cold shock CspA family protein